MSKETRRYMRMLVFFDLPMVNAAEKRAYNRFRRFLLNDGYDMLQYSVYGRIVYGRDAEQKHLQRLSNNLPSEGSIRLLTVTEKQYASMRLLLGKPKVQEKKLMHSNFYYFKLV
jgi:CRISPR-associated protein Cas2